MSGSLLTVIHCILYMHDPRLMLVAGLVCAVGIYASFAIGHHAARAAGYAKIRWGIASVLASGSTAWATHFIVLLAFEPGMPAAFEPVVTAISLTCAIAGIGAGVWFSIKARCRVEQFLAGMVLGAGVITLHYVGQSAYLVQGTVAWNLYLVVPSILLSLPLSGFAMIAVGSRKRRVRAVAAPLLLTSIALLHFCGMAAMTLHYDPTVQLPSDAVSPAAITPVVAGVCFALIVLAVMGYRFDLAAAARLRQDHRRLRELADVALEGLLICRGDTIVTANRSIECLSGHPAETLSGCYVSSLLPGLDMTSLPEREEREINLVNAEGHDVPVRVLRREVALGHKVQTVIAVRDQRERLRTEAKMRLLAFTDALTGLANRTRFFDLLAQHVASRRSRDRACSVLMLDLDRFKAINDTLGHHAGDIVLSMAADRLRSVVASDDVVARLGGDEFAILQVETGGEDAASALAQRIVDSIGARPFRFEGQAIHLGVSVGIAVAPEDGDDPSELMRNADLALYAAKASGRATFRHYDVMLDERMRERRSIEDGLRVALAEGQLELYYQPLLDTGTGEVGSVEALVRWNHPERGLVLPGDFIGIAEECGLIVPLGDWVVRAACADAVTWPEEIDVAINLSPAQFRDAALVRTITEALDASGLAPGRLELEVTEGVLLSDEAGTLKTLNQLKDLGVRVSMDDFGTGYSSLSYLRKFPFDKIKIDQSFVREVPHDAESLAIVRAIITMAKCLGMSTTVEGVETMEQFDYSVEAGCDTIQGFLIGRPMDRTALLSVLSGARKAGPAAAAA